MKINAAIIEHQQGSPAWLEHRTKSLNASELAAAIGISPYLTRAELIAQKSTGLVPDVDAATQRIFDNGHRYEAIARPWAEEIIGADLFPVVLAAEIDGLPLSASLDGQTMAGDITFEHKTCQAALIASLESGVIPEEYHPQMEQGLLLSGASRCLFMASSGDREAMRFAWYESNPELRAKIIPTWKQFAEDLKAYVPPAAAPVVVAEPVQALPAVLVQVSGEIAIKDNFKAFETALRDFLDHRLIREPKTDQDFADLDLQIKAMKGAEEALAGAEAQMLAQVQSIDQAKKTKDMLAKLVRDNRLMAETMLKNEKERRRGEIVAESTKKIMAHIASLNARLTGDTNRNFMPPVQVDFVGAIKGLKTLTSMENAVDTELARVKIEASQIADKIEINLRWLRENATEYAHLFADTGTLVLKAPDDFRAQAENRISTEKARKQAEQDRIREEAAAKARADLIAEQAAKTTAPAVQAAVQEQRRTGTGIVEMSVSAGQVQARHIPTAAVIDNEKPTLKLGQINERIAPLSITADGLASLGFTHVATDKAAKLYPESLMDDILDSLIAHIQSRKSVALCKEFA